MPLRSPHHIWLWLLLDNHLTPQEVGTAPISPSSFEKVPYMPKGTKPVSVGCETDGNFTPGLWAGGFQGVDLSGVSSPLLGRTAGWT